MMWVGSSDVRRATLALVATCLALGASPARAVTFTPAGAGALSKQDLIAKLSSDINKVDHSIEVTKELIRKSPDAPYLADLYFRLAELYVERSRYVYSRLMEQQPEGEGSLSGEKALEVQISKRLAIETYDRIIREFPEYQQVPQIRFFKAHEYRELGEFDTMLTLYRELIDAHPKSDWAIEARLILGDYYFDKGELGPAELQYLGILALPESHLHDMARYKLGWIRINQQRFPDALQFFQDAVSSKRHKKRGAVGDAKGLDVKREAMLALTWPFTEVKKPYQAPKYFRDLADTKTIYVAALKKLANRYFVKTEYQSAATLYREIVKYQADVEENIDFLQRIYDSVRNMSKNNSRRYAHAEGDVRAIVDTVSQFLNHQRYSEEEKKKLAADFELRARDLATRLQLDAQRKNSKSRALRAAEAYRQYLSVWGDDKEATSQRLNRAAALYQGEKYLEAALEYETVAKGQDDTAKQRENVYNAVQAFHKALEDDAAFRQKNPTEEGILNRLELLQAREGLKQLGAYYVKTWPKSNEAADVKFNVAKMYYQQGEYERGAELFAAFVREYPTHKDATVAGNLALDALNRADNLDALAKLADEFVANGAIRDRAFKNQAAEIAKSARRRKVELAVVSTTEGDFSERMLEEWEKHQGSQEGEEFLYTAFVKFKNENNIAGVFDFGGRLVGAYPKSERLQDVLTTMGNFAIRGADFERAAFLFEEFYKRFPKAPNAADLLGNAASVRFMLGQVNEAGDDFRVLRRVASGEKARNAHEQLMTMYREASDWESLGRVARTALEANRGWLGAAAHLGLAYAETDRIELAARELEKLASLRAQSNFDKMAQGLGNFTLGRVLQARFDEIEFAGGATAEQVLGQKIQYLETIERAYVGAISSGHGKWAIAALQSVARMYRDFGEFIKRAPVPDGLDAAGRQQYQQALAQQGGAYLAKAKEAVQACAQKAKELNVFTAHASACLSGGVDPVVMDTTRRRSEGSDESFLKEVAEIRTQLAKTPESMELLMRLATRAIQVGDFHLARLTLLRALELRPADAAARNLLGVAAWSLGETQDAYAQLEQATKARNTDAALNLAALYAEYGYSDASTRVLRSVSTSGVDTSRPQLHPSVRVLLGGGDGEEEPGS